MEQSVETKPLLSHCADVHLHWHGHCSSRHGQSCVSSAPESSPSREPSSRALRNHARSACTSPRRDSTQVPRSNLRAHLSGGSASWLHLRHDQLFMATTHLLRRRTRGGVRQAHSYSLLL